MEIGVRVEAEDLRTGLVTHIASAYLTFVALDDNKRPTPVPPYNPETPEALRRKKQAQERKMCYFQSKNQTPE
jgi:acyl-CoA hydrolase